MQESDPKLPMMRAKKGEGGLGTHILAPTGEVKLSCVSRTKVLSNLYTPRFLETGCQAGQPRLSRLEKLSWCQDKDSTEGIPSSVHLVIQLGPGWASGNSSMLHQPGWRVSEHG